MDLQLESLVAVLGDVRRPKVLVEQPGHRCNGHGRAAGDQTRRRVEEPVRPAVALYLAADGRVASAVRPRGLPGVGPLLKPADDLRKSHL